ncbi:hypothetical protein CONPUDRAFT_51767, partial [Coniophora puteana RWD-64-598 SS2]
VVGDLILIFLPFRMLWRTKLAASFRKLLLTVFAMSVLNTAATVVHIVLILQPPGFFTGLTANLHASVTLLVCNLLVITTFCYRIFRGTDIESTVTMVTTRPTSTPTTFTTVELNSLQSVSHAAGFWSDVNSGTGGDGSRGFHEDVRSVSINL